MCYYQVFNRRVVVHTPVGDGHSSAILLSGHSIELTDITGVDDNKGVASETPSKCLTVWLQFHTVTKVGQKNS